MMKNNLKIYPQKSGQFRKNENLKEIVKSDVNFPDSVMHEDLDKGILNFFKDECDKLITSKKIPFIPIILTLERWGEVTQTWSYLDERNNIQVPFITLVRDPLVKMGENPIGFRTIPNRKTFNYRIVEKSENGLKGADIYKIPQPISVDITYELIIVSNDIRELNSFNFIMMKLFSSIQTYITVKGHYIPLKLQNYSDNSEITTIDKRKFYRQSYEILLQGFLLNSDEFEVVPAMSKISLATEFIEKRKTKEVISKKDLDITFATFIAQDGETTFNVGEPINLLFYVTLNGLIQELGVDYFFIPNTFKITFSNGLSSGDKVVIAYYKKTSEYKLITDSSIVVSLGKEYFNYQNEDILITSNTIVDVVSVDFNGLVQIENEAYTFNGHEVSILQKPEMDTKIGIIYLY